MSFLPGRLAATEGAYFLHQSKHAAARLADTLPAPSSPSPSSPAAAAAADVLPEILRHSIPISSKSHSSSSLSAPSKWLLDSSHSPSPSQAHVNPLRAFVSLPPATFGPRRWQVPSQGPHFSPSTANDLRLRQDFSSLPPPPDPDRLNALMRAYSQIGKAFAAATLLIFGGVTALSLYTAHKLQLHSTEDIRTKGRDAIQPRVHSLKQRIAPLRSSVEKISTKWHVHANKEAKQNPVIKEFSKAMGVNKNPN